ncbi:aluminum resistance family protein, partial [Candidatus Arthromitus sp. SFB-3]
QKNSPVDSFLECEPWDMPGYNDQVIMAAGTFISGSSIELSCDAPIREPYVAYLQGSLTFEHGQLAILNSIKN